MKNRQTNHFSTQLAETSHHFTEAIKTAGQADVVFSDFAKAFDRVSHNKLILKV